MKKILSFLLSFIFCMLFSERAFSEFLFSPTIVVIDAPAGMGATSVEISNPMNKPVRLQLSLGEWDMDKDGRIIATEKEQEQITQYIKITPMQFTLLPDQKRKVRIACSLPFDVENKEYKLFLKMLEISADRKEFSSNNKQYRMGLNVNKEMQVGTYIRKGPESSLYANIKFKDFEVKKNKDDSGKLKFSYNFKYENEGNIHKRKKVGARFFDAQGNVFWETKELGSFIVVPTPKDSSIKYGNTVYFPDEEKFSKASEIQFVFIDKSVRESDSVEKLDDNIFSERIKIVSTNE